jgi:hypothetical protein
MARAVHQHNSQLLATHVGGGVGGGGPRAQAGCWQAAPATSMNAHAMRAVVHDDLLCRFISLTHAHDTAAAVRAAQAGRQGTAVVEGISGGCSS